MRGTEPFRESGNGSISAHKFECNPKLDVAVGENQVYSDAENGTHLTVDRSRNVHADNGKYHSYETADAREGVDLSSEQLSLVLLYGRKTKVEG